MPRTPVICALVAAVCLLSSLAHAAELSIVQLNKKFDQTTMTIKKGDTVIFANKDPFTHNVYSESPKVGFDLKTQAPGQSSPVTFNTSGEALVECAIHPSMKLTIKITE